MDKNRLKSIVLDQRSIFFDRGELIDRDVDLTKYLSTGQIVVISGVRRCGKSALLSIIHQKLKLLQEEVCYLNFDDERLDNSVELLSELYALHLEMYQKKPTFFFDEIQLVPNWEKFVNRMYEQGLKVFVTGSNAKLLSSEIATTLTGRTKVLSLFPFSFKEYLRFHKKKFKLNALSVKEESLLKSELGNYLQTGGFPLVVKEKDIDILNGWFQDILYRDIVARYNLTSIDEIRQMAIYLITNIGKLFTYSTLQKITGIKSTNSIKDYLEYFEASYLFFYLKKFDYSVRKQIMNSRKVYVIDNGVHRRLGINFSKNIGRVMENTVFLELLRRKKELFYHKGKSECDFVLVENLKVTEAIQVTYELTIENIERELRGLDEAYESYKVKQLTLIVFEKPKIEVDKKIKVITLYDWLLGEE